MSEQGGSNGMVVGIGCVAVVLLFGLPILVIVLLSAIAGAGQQDQEECEHPDDGAAAPDNTVTVDTDSLPDEVAGYDGEQLENAALIVQAGEDLDLSGRDQTIGVMTAIGESSLVNLDYGDDVGPDSRGLFQQRAEGWGTEEERMDPYSAATAFFEALQDVADRDQMAPTLVAHEVQANADPHHYERFWDSAVEVVEALDAENLDITSPSGGGTGPGVSAAGTDECDPSGGSQYTGEISTDGWALPAEGEVTSGFYVRSHPAVRGGECILHPGIDFGSPTWGDPIWAAHDGTVTHIENNEGSGHQLIIDLADGSGLMRHHHIHGPHSHNSGPSAAEVEIFVEVGDEVEAGDHIANVGDTGHQTSGAHLHWEVHDADGPVDPAAVLEDAGHDLTYGPNAFAGRDSCDQSEVGG